MKNLIIALALTVMIASVTLSSSLPLTTSTNRRAANNLYNLEVDGRDYCPAFNTSFQIVAPMQMSSNDGNFQTSYSQFLASNLMADRINTMSCGVVASKEEGKEKAPMFLDVLGIADEKNAIKAAHIVNVSATLNLRDGQPFGYKGAYSSGVAKGMVDLMLQNEKMGIFPGSSSTSIFAGNTLIFGMLIPSNTFLVPVFDVFGSTLSDGLGLRNVSYVSDARGLTTGICNTIPQFAADNEMEVINSWSFTDEEFKDEAIMDDVVNTLNER